MDKKFHELESKLIAQEHRTWALFSNFFKYIFSNDKKRRKISVLALIFNFFLSKSTIAIAISSFLGIFLAFQSNELLKSQNLLIKEQSHLTEANRRSSLIFLSSSIIDKIDDELKEPGNSKRALSSQLISRISALTYSLKPYRFLKNDTLIESPLSPERGQLLLTLANSNIDSSSLQLILNKSNFEYADLEDAIFDDVILNKAKLNYSNLERAQFNHCIMEDIRLKNCNLKDTFFRNSDINLAWFDYSDLYHTRFKNMIKMKGISFNEATLDSTSITNSDLGYFWGDNLDISGFVFNNVTINDSLWTRIISKTEGRKAFIDNHNIKKNNSDGTYSITIK